MRPRTIVMRATLAALLATAPVLVLAGPAAAVVVVVADDTYTVDEDTLLVGDVADNDIDEGFGYGVSVLSSPSHGLLTLDADGSFLYQPALDFNGSDSFTYLAVDDLLPPQTATVTITVTAVVDRPRGEPDAYSTPGGTRLLVAEPGLFGNDSSPDGGTLEYGSNTPAGNGLVYVYTNGAVDYLPTPGFRGVDTFEYTVFDGVSQSLSVPVTITVGNTAPVAEPDAYVLSEDTPLDTANVLDNDTDANGDALTADLVSDTSNGVLLLAPDGTFTYTPSADFNGVDSFTYQVSDGTDTSVPTTVTLAVDAVADRPVFAVPILAVTALEDSTFSGQTTATNPDGLPLAYTAETTGTPTGAVVMNAATGAYAFTPEPDFVGLAQLDVFACDTFGQCASQLINITVTNVNDAPVAADQSVSVSHGTPVPQMLDVRDIDSQVLTFIVTSAAQRGTVAIDADMWTFVYTPAAGASGLDSFVVEICDADGLCDSATVTVDVAAAPPAAVTPVAVPVVPTAAAPAGSDALPVTGSDVTSLALGALGMIGLGGVLVARSVRRPDRA